MRESSFLPIPTLPLVPPPPPPPIFVFAVPRWRHLSLRLCPAPIGSPLPRKRTPPAWPGRLEHRADDGRIYGRPIL